MRTIVLAGSILLTVLTGVALAPAAVAATPFVEVQGSADIGQRLAGVSLGHSSVFTEAGGSITHYPLAGIPVGADVDGFALDWSGNALLSLDIDASLPGPLTARHNDIVAYDGTDWWLVFDGVGAGVPEGVDLDGLSLSAGALVLSFDTSFAAGGDTFADEDLLRLDGTGLTMFFDASAARIDASADVDAVHVLPNGHLLVSFETGGSVDGLTYDHADVLEYDPDGDSWDLAYRSSLLPGWVTADLNAFSAITDSDGDGVYDHLDNCLGLANADQRDTDGDGFGNRCDADLNDDCVVNAIDLGILKSLFFSNDADADLDGDGLVNVVDLGLLRSRFFAPPGPGAVDNNCQPGPGVSG